jgi:uncharacterized membrane protein
MRFSTKSGGRQPAVGGRIRIGRHERHSSADRQRCVCGLSLQLRLKLPRGAYAPRSCVAVRTSAGETTIFAMHKRTFAQERRASAHRGSEMRWWTQCDFRRGMHPVHKSGGRQPAVGGHMRVGRHERHSSADRQRCVCGLPLQLRLKLPRGAYAPRSCVAVRTSAGETTIFAMYKRTFDQERRASARRGWTPARRQTRASFVGRPPTVCVRIAVAIAFKATTGAYAPRSCVAVRTSAGETTIFAMHKRTFAQERRASARRGALPICDIGSCHPGTNELLGEPTPGGT